MKSYTLTNEHKIIEKQSDILSAINEFLNIEIKGDPDKFINKDLQIIGKDKLEQELSMFFKQQKEKIRENTLKKLKKENFQVLNLDKISKEIQYLSHMYESTQIVETPSPKDIFSAEDYTDTADYIELNSLNNIPDEYVDFLNPLEIKNYFENENTVTIQIDKSDWLGETKPEIIWKIRFNNNQDISYSDFVSTYKNFIASFIEATANLITTKNIELDNELTSYLKTNLK